MAGTFQTKTYGELRYVRSFMATGERHICELVGGGYARVDGTPIQTEAELHAVISPPHLAKALDWWAHRDEERPTEPARAVLFVRGAPCYADTGEELGSLNEVLSAFPDRNPFREAALVWWQEKATRQHAAEQAQALALSQTSGLGPDEVPVKRRPVGAAGPQARPGHRVERLYQTEAGEDGGQAA
jgi:hypothetical protein